MRDRKRASTQAPLRLYEELVAVTTDPLDDGAATAEDEGGGASEAPLDPYILRTLAISSAITFSATAENSFFTGSITNFYNIFDDFRNRIPNQSASQITGFKHQSARAGALTLGVP